MVNSSGGKLAFEPNATTETAMWENLPANLPTSAKELTFKKWDFFHVTRATIVCLLKNFQGEAMRKNNVNGFYGSCPYYQQHMINEF